VIPESSTWLLVTSLIGWLIRLVMGLVIILRRRTPSTALAWLLLVFTAPIIGSFIYFMIGENRLGSKRTREYSRIVRQVESMQRFTLPDLHALQPSIPEKYRPLASLAEGLGGSPPLAGNELDLFDDTQMFIRALVADIDRARYHCHLLYYIYHEDRAGHQVVEALIRARRRGVVCRLLLDGVGSRGFLRSDQVARLRANGVQVAAALPVNALRARVARVDLRNHRKLAVIDGQIAYTGSHNLSEPIYPGKQNYGAWVDATVRVTGPIVHPLQLLFIEDWYLDTDELAEDDHLLPPTNNLPGPGVGAQLLPTGPISSVESPLQRVMLQAMHLATEQIIFTTPYFVPDEAMIGGLGSAALRGVRTVLVVPHRADNRIAAAAGRAFYGELLRWGVEIQEYTAGLLHAKTLTVDREFAFLGTANLDMRSFMLNFELALLIYESDFASKVRFLQESYISSSVRLRHEVWRQRSAARIIIENSAKLASPLL